ncbi:unnamed protein product, partial [marine sediment metagenome]
YYGTNIALEGVIGNKTGQLKLFKGGGNYEYRRVNKV